MSPLTLSAIYIYPIKSLGGIALQRAQVQKRGLQYDRRWMLVDDQGMFITQRTHPEMALLKMAMREDKFIIAHTSKPYEVIALPFEPPAASLASTMKVEVWGSQVEAICVGKQYDQWFSEQLGFACHLVYMGDESVRPVSQDYNRGADEVSFADGYPYLIIGEASLADLNSRLSQALPMDRFRPNFVFAGGTPFIEDTWKAFKIGSLSFTTTKPCTRCNLTTIDQQTAISSPQKEPLRTLATFRRQGNEVIFGMNVLANGEGEIEVGEELVVL